MSDDPLIPGPLYGLRTWRVAVEDDVERLAAPHRGTIWPPGGEWIEATCGRAGHAAPTAGCDCGIHAFHPRRATARAVLAARREVPGIVEADGPTEVHEDGFRAARARPHALVVTPGSNARQIARLADAYGAAVVEMRGPDDLLAWCAERGFGLEEPVVAQLLGPGERNAKARRRRTGALRIAAALVVASILVVAGSQVIPKEPSGERLKGRAGEIRTP
jgi:hypothetical protein